MAISALLLGFYWHYSRVDGSVGQWVTILDGLCRSWVTWHWLM